MGMWNWNWIWIELDWDLGLFGWVERKMMDDIKGGCYMNSISELSRSKAGWGSYYDE